MRQLLSPDFLRTLLSRGPRQALWLPQVSEEARRRRKTTDWFGAGDNSSRGEVSRDYNLRSEDGKNSRQHNFSQSWTKSGTIFCEARAGTRVYAGKSSRTVYGAKPALAPCVNCFPRIPRVNWSPDSGQQFTQDSGDNGLRMQSEDNCLRRES